MAANLPKAIQFSAFALNGIVGNPQALSKDVLHGAMDYIIAQWKKGVEICDSLSENQKEELKKRCEAVFKGLESLVEDSLKCHGRLQ